MSTINKVEGDSIYWNDGSGVEQSAPIPINKWQSYTPALTWTFGSGGGGSIVSQITGRYFKIGTLVLFLITINATSGNLVGVVFEQVTLPTTAAGIATISVAGTAVGGSISPNTNYVSFSVDVSAPEIFSFSGFYESAS